MKISFSFKNFIDDLPTTFVGLFLLVISLAICGEGFLPWWTLVITIPVALLFGCLNFNTPLENSDVE